MADNNQNPYVATYLPVPQHGAQMQQFPAMMAVPYPQQQQAFAHPFASPQPYVINFSNAVPMANLSAPQTAELCYLCNATATTRCTKCGAAVCVSCTSVVDEGRGRYIQTHVACRQCSVEIHKCNRVRWIFGMVFMFVFLAIFGVMFFTIFGVFRRTKV